MKTSSYDFNRTAFIEYIEKLNLKEGQFETLLSLAQRMAKGSAMDIANSISTHLNVYDDTTSISTK